MPSPRLSLFVIINPVGGGHELAKTVLARGHGLIPIFTMPRSRVAQEILQELDVASVCFERDPQQILRVIEHERRRRGGPGSQIVAVLSGDAAGLLLANILAHALHLADHTPSRQNAPSLGAGPRETTPPPPSTLGKSIRTPRAVSSSLSTADVDTHEYIVDLCATAGGEYVEWGVWHCLTIPTKGRRSMRSLPPDRPFTEALVARAKSAARALRMTRGPIQCVVRMPRRGELEMIQVGPLVPSRAVQELYRRTGRGDFCQQAIRAFVTAGTVLPPPVPKGYAFMAVEQAVVNVGKGAAIVRGIHGLDAVARLNSLVQLTRTVQVGDVLCTTGEEEPPVYATFAHADEKELMRDCESFHNAVGLELDPLPANLAAFYHSVLRPDRPR